MALITWLAIITAMAIIGIGITVIYNRKILFPKHGRQ
jgi:hypothetical protein